MTNIKEKETPVLTLDPLMQEVGELDVKTLTKNVDESNLTPEEKKMVDEFAQQIDISNTNVILQYGSGAQQKMAEFSESALQNVKTKDLDEVSDMITSLVVELKGFDLDEKKGIIGLFKKSANKLQALKAKYNDVSINIQTIVDHLERHQYTLYKDIAMLDEMYKRNLTNFKELSMYIIAGQKKLEEVRATTLQELIDKAKTSGLPEDSQKANDFAELCNRFEKKLYDLKLTREISIQMGPQIRLVQGGDTLMVEKIQSTLQNTIPLWKTKWSSL